MSNAVSLDVFPWSVIVPELERQVVHPAKPGAANTLCWLQKHTDDLVAVKKDFAKNTLRMWQEMVYSTAYQDPPQGGGLDPKGQHHG